MTIEVRVRVVVSSAVVEHSSHVRNKEVHVGVVPTSQALRHRAQI